jgi:quercetin dioxygenase-like cupin family protein
VPIEKPTPKIVKKGWGHEEIWAATPEYCGKLLCFKEAKKSSLHFHCNKTETWRCLSGSFTIEIVDPTNGVQRFLPFVPGEVFHLPTATVHRLICWEEGIVLEVSTYDDPDDNYRVAPGDSQAVAQC